jgi:predicted nucleotidyltransferase component of viral defense system
MIDRREILDAAAQTSLTPHVVEKDYVLGWMLAGISRHPELADNWVFKGGTCLKKCFFETYRFSEDLDFTLRDAFSRTHVARSCARARSVTKALFRQAMDYQESSLI